MNGCAIGQSDHLEQVAQIVRDERVAAPLGKEAEHDGDEKAAAHAGGGDEGEPGGGGALVGGGLAFQGECGVDLGDFGLDKLGSWVGFGVVGGEDCVGFFEAVVGDEPAGGFGEEAEFVNVNTMSFGDFRDAGKSSGVG